MSDETWRPVAGYEGLYAVSDRGRVMTYRAPGTRVLSSVGHLLSPTLNYRGYRKVQLFKDGKPKNALVHRLVAAAFIPNPENLESVNHIDADRGHNDVRNLEWLSPRGEDHPNAKLNEQQVLDIRASSLSVRKLGALYGLHPSSIHEVKRGRIWAHV